MGDRPRLSTLTKEERKRLSVPYCLSPIASFSEAELAEMDGALAVLERHFAPLPELTPDERRQLTKMGDKSEAFCRQTLVVLAQHPEVLPANFDLTEAQNDLKQLDQLRPRLHRLERLQGKGWDADTALGSDAMSACLDGYALLKVTGKGAGLEALRAGMSRLFTRAGKATPPPPPVYRSRGGPPAMVHCPGLGASRPGPGPWTLRAVRRVLRATPRAWRAKQRALRTERRALCTERRALRTKGRALRATHQAWRVERPTLHAQP